MNLKSNNKNKTSKTWLYILFAVILVVACIVVFAVLSITRPANKNEVTLPDNNGSISNGVNYAPATEAEKQEGLNTQKQLEENANKTTPLTMRLTDAKQYGDTIEIRAFLSGSLEQAGICTAVLKNGSQTVQQTSQAFTDAQTIQCGSIDIPLAKFLSSGEYDLTVSYKSNSSDVSSTATKVIVKK